MAAAAATGTFHHLPFQPDGADWLAAADVHLLTSREDPFPSVVLEAMSAGVPTVAFEEAGSIPDLLREFAAGLAVPLGDAAAMVRQMRALALQRDDEDRARLARAARARFAFDLYADTLLRVAGVVAPDVSACVINYNYARFLPARLRSVFAQTLAPREILVLDDASTDDSAEVVRQVAAEDGRDVTWVSARRRGGVFAQWRRAAERARGEFVWIAEADDEAEPTLLEQVCRLMQSAPDCRFGFADSQAIDPASETLWADHKPYYAELGRPLLRASEVIPAARFLRDCLGARNLVLNASAVVWRREALLAALGRAAPTLPRLRLAGDWLLYAAALADGGTVAYVAEPLNRHRRHGSGVTGRLSPEDHLDEIKAMHRHMRGMVGADPALRAEQRRALVAARRALQPAKA